MEHPKDELAGLRQFLKALKSGDLKLHRAHKDVTAQEIEVLEREIKHLETVLARHAEG